MLLLTLSSLRPPCAVYFSVLLVIVRSPSAGLSGGIAVPVLVLVLGVVLVLLVGVVARVHVLVRFPGSPARISPYE